MTEKKLSSVIYLGHLPNGFFEAQIREYFAQFGIVKKVKVCRSKKTANSKGYGFVKFGSPEVAKIAADAMNNYLMFDKILKCEVLPESRVHAELFKGSGKVFTPSAWPRIQVSQVNRPKTEAKSKEIREKILRNLAKKNMKLAQMGINYTFPGTSSIGDISADKGDLKAELVTPCESCDEDNLSQGEMDASVYSLLVDSSDEDEIQFKTPPGAIRRKKTKGKGDPSAN